MAMIYLDNAATTNVSEEVYDAMKPYFCELYANPSAIYSFAGKSMKAINEARHSVASLIGANDKEIYFTASGSEADNWAIKATAFKYKDKGRHIITSVIEHHAVLNTCKYLENEGFEVTYIGVDSDGIIKLEELKKAIRSDTILISIMTANNEIGTLQPISDIGKIAKEHNILFHTDAVQAFGHIPLNVDEMNIDMLSASAHKLHGPKGVGVLYIRNGVNIEPFIHGGAQERSKRAGTHNTAGIVGFGVAAKIAKENLEANMKYESELRDYMINRILNEVENIVLNGHISKRLPNNINISFKHIEGGALLILLDQKGVCASSGSACTTGSSTPSHVLMAIGLSQEMARGSLRLTLSEHTSKSDIDRAVDAIKEVVDKLRNLVLG